MIINNHLNYLQMNRFVYTGKEAIPSSATNVDVSDEVSQLNPGDIPVGVTRLSFSNKFNRKLPSGYIPDGVTHLTFGWRFNQPLCPGDIPQSVVEIEFGKYKQYFVEGILPKTLKRLSYGAQEYSYRHKEFDLYTDIVDLEKITFPFRFDNLEVYDVGNYF
jgi:hypothetical protein